MTQERERERKGTRQTRDDVQGRRDEREEMRGEIKYHEVAEDKQSIEEKSAARPKMGEEIGKLKDADDKRKEHKAV